MGLTQPAPPDHPEDFLGERSVACALIAQAVRDLESPRQCHAARRFLTVDYPQTIWSEWLPSVRPQALAQVVVTKVPTEP